MPQEKKIKPLYTVVCMCVCVCVCVCMFACICCIYQKSASTVSSEQCSHKNTQLNQHPFLAEDTKRNICLPYVSYDFPTKRFPIKIETYLGAHKDFGAHKILKIVVLSFLYFH